MIGKTLFILCLFAQGVEAHPLAPALLELREQAGGVVDVRWKTPLLKQTGVRLQPIMPARCRSVAQPETGIDATSVTVSWSIECGPAGMAGARIGVDGAGRSTTDTVLRIELADGRSLHSILRGGEAAFVIPERASRTAVSLQYAALGLDHILGGIDHLLFVFGLVLLVPARGMLVRTVTSFTAGHSVTLSLAALGFTSFPAGLIEVLIALTILLLAIELARPRRSLMRRAPWAMAFIFGLLHGFGFAGALRDIGLPAGEIPAALFSFNAGIEIGQLLFIAALLSCRRLPNPLSAWSAGYARSLPVYAMGSLAAFWFFERTAQWLG